MDVTERWNTCRHLQVSKKVGTICIEIVVVFNNCSKALTRQVNDLQELLGSEWDHRGVGRDDGKEAGEFRFSLYVGLRYFVSVNPTI